MPQPAPADNVPRVTAYYDRSTWLYRWFYYDRESLAMHYGFWDRDDTPRVEALVAQYRQVAQRLRLAPSHHVLDAGCGVAGASCWMASHTPARITGITVSPYQVELGRRYVARRGLADRVFIERRDYFATGFPDSSFDGAFGIESFCYSNPTPEALYREMYRVLKPGGILVISDGVLSRAPEGERERALVDALCRGFRMPGWNTVAEILAALGRAGFRELTCEDRTAQVRPSVLEIARISRRLGPWARAARRLRLVSSTEEENLLATEAQEELYFRGLAGYAIFTATKPG